MKPLLQYTHIYSTIPMPKPKEETMVWVKVFYATGFLKRWFESEEEALSYADNAETCGRRIQTSFTRRPRLRSDYYDPVYRW